MADKQVNHWVTRKVGEKEPLTVSHHEWLGDSETLANVTAASGNTAKVTVGTPTIGATVKDFPVDSKKPDGLRVDAPANTWSTTPCSVIAGADGDIVYVDLTLTSSNADRVDIETVGIRIVE